MTKLKYPLKDVIDYITAAILEFGDRHGLTLAQATNYLRRYSGLDFLVEFYDVEHTLSFSDCVEDLTIICQKNGGGLR